MIKRLLEAIGRSSLYRYIIIGGVTYSLELILLYFLVKTGASEVAAVAISFWFGLAISFVLQKILAFQNNHHAPRILIRQSLLYGLLVVINYVFTLWFVWLASPATGLFIARTVALLVTTSWNYFAYRHVIFRS